MRMKDLRVGEDYALSLVEFSGRYRKVTVLETSLTPSERPDGARTEVKVRCEDGRVAQYPSRVLRHPWKHVADRELRLRALIAQTESLADQLDVIDGVTASVRVQARLHVHFEQATLGDLLIVTGRSASSDPEGYRQLAAAFGVWNVVGRTSLSAHALAVDLDRHDPYPLIEALTEMQARRSANRSALEGLLS